MPHIQFLPKGLGLATIIEEANPSTSACRPMDTVYECSEIEPLTGENSDPEDLALTPEPSQHRWDSMVDIDELFRSSNNTTSRNDEDLGAYSNQDDESPVSCGDEVEDAQADDRRSSPDYMPLVECDDSTAGLDDLFKAYLCNGENSSSEYSPDSPAITSSDVEVVIERPKIRHYEPTEHNQRLPRCCHGVTTALELAGQQALFKGVLKRKQFEDAEEAAAPCKLPRIDTGQTTPRIEIVTPIGQARNFVEILAECVDGDGTWYKVQWRETWLHEQHMPPITPIRMDHLMRHGESWRIVPPRARMV